MNSSMMNKLIACVPKLNANPGESDSKMNIFSSIERTFMRLQFPTLFLTGSLFLNNALGGTTTTAAPKTERELIDILQSTASPDKKALACKRLTLYGTKAAVPALAQSSQSF